MMTDLAAAETPCALEARRDGSRLRAVLQLEDLRQRHAEQAERTHLHEVAATCAVTIAYRPTSRNVQHGGLP